MLLIEPTYRLKSRRTKVIATIGPASQSVDILRQLLKHGVNLMRLNFSHGTHADHLLTLNNLKAVAQDLGQPITVLGDLSGPKIRVGRFEDGAITLEEGTDVTITTKDVLGRGGLIPSQYPHLAGDLEMDQALLFDDGRLEVRVTHIDPPHTATCRVVRGGVLKDHKGINLPDTRLSISAITEKDRRDLAFCVEHDFDYVALSFVQSANDIAELRQLAEERVASLQARGASVATPPRIIAKIEKTQALDDITEIIDQADGIMIARGDLGVEMAPEKVPLIQDQLIHLARQRNKPVIVATQMLETMIDNARPTRAEVSDVAHAVAEMADAVMLSGETAVGKYPVEAVRMMDTVLREVESHQWSRQVFGALHSDLSIYPLPNALARAATLLSQDMELRALNTWTRTGRTARILAASRPNAPVLAFCADRKLANQMQLYWGLIPIYAPQAETFEQFTILVNETVKARELASAGHHILLVSSSAAFNKEQDLHSLTLCQVM